MYLKNGVIAIFENDLNFANHLMDYFNRKSNSLFQTIVFTKPESIEEYSENNAIDIILMSEDIVYDISQLSNLKVIIILTEEKERNEYASDSYHCKCLYLYKYQSAETMLQEISNLYLQHQKSSTTNIKGVPISNTKIILVYSPNCSSMQTSFSLLLAKAYSDEKKTLFLNLEQFSALSLLTRNEEVYNLSDLIYYLKQENSNSHLKINTLIQNIENLDYISGLENAFDLYEMTKENIFYLIEQLKLHNNYEVIIINVCFLNNIMLRLFDQSEYIYILKESNEASRKKVEEFKRLIALEGYTQILEKSECIEIPYEVNQLISNHNSDVNLDTMGEFIKKIIN